MVAADTIVGIVGAVVLVAVMAGVFVYEYNNPATDATPGGGDGNATFATAYPGLDAKGDIDGDGIANAMDSDIDGDGTNNTADHDTAVVYGADTFTLGPQVGTVVVPAVELKDMKAENGTLHIEGTVTATSAQPCNLLVELRGPDGKAVAQGSITPTGSKMVTVQTTMGDPVDAGSYTVHVGQNTAGAGCTVSITGTVHYPAPAGAGHDHNA